MDIIKAIEDYDYYFIITGESKKNWEDWREKEIKEWMLSREKLKKTGKEKVSATKKKSISIVRRIDNLGRITIPVEFKKRLLLNNGAPVELSIEGEEITIRKHEVYEMILSTVKVLMGQVMNYSDVVGFEESKKIIKILSSIESELNKQGKSL